MRPDLNLTNHFLQLLRKPETLQFDQIRDLDGQYEIGTNIEEELNIKDVWKLFIFCLFS